MLHSGLNTGKSNPRLHRALTYGLVQHALSFSPGVSLTDDGLAQTQFILRTGLPEATFEALVDSGCIDHKQQGVFGVQYPHMNLRFFFYYQSVRIGSIAWLIVYDLGQPLVMSALQQWRTEDGIHVVFEQSSGTYGVFLRNSCIGECCFLDEAQCDEPSMLRIETLFRLFQSNSPEVHALLDAPSMQLMVVSAGEDYARHLRPHNLHAKQGKRAARSGKRRR